MVPLSVRDATASLSTWMIALCTSHPPPKPCRTCVISSSLSLLRRISTIFLAVSITGFVHYPGLGEDRSVIRMAPPTRFPCRRLNHRCVVLADGSVTACDQDLGGDHVIGTLDAHTLGELWRQGRLQELRHAHHAGRFDVTTLCAACAEWHRP